jgi:hypothetical protein
VITSPCSFRTRSWQFRLCPVVPPSDTRRPVCNLYLSFNSNLPRPHRHTLSMMWRRVVW